MIDIEQQRKRMGGGDEMPERIGDRSAEIKAAKPRGECNHVQDEGEPIHPADLEDAERFANGGYGVNDWGEDVRTFALRLVREIRRLRAEAAAMREVLEDVCIDVDDTLSYEECKCCWQRRNKGSIAHKSDCIVAKVLAPDAGKAILEKLERFDELLAWAKFTIESTKAHRGICPCDRVMYWRKPPEWIND